MEPLQWLLVPYEEYCANNPEKHDFHKNPYPKSKEAQHIRDEMISFRTKGAESNYVPDTATDITDQATEIPETEHNDVDAHETGAEADTAEDTLSEPIEEKRDASTEETPESTSKEKPSDITSDAVTHDIPIKLRDASKFMSKQANGRSTKLYQLLINLPNSSYDDLHDSYQFDNFQIDSSSLLARLLNDFCTKRSATSKTSPPEMEKFWQLLSQIDAAKKFGGAFYRAQYSNNDVTTVRKSERIKSVRLTNPPSFSSLKL